MRVAVNLNELDQGVQQEKEMPEKDALQWQGAVYTIGGGRLAKLRRTIRYHPDFLTACRPTVVYPGTTLAEIACLRGQWECASFLLNAGGRLDFSPEAPVWDALGKRPFPVAWFRSEVAPRVPPWVDERARVRSPQSEATLWAVWLRRDPERWACWVDLGRRPPETLLADCLCTHRWNEASRLLDTWPLSSFVPACSWDTPWEKSKTWEERVRTCAQLGDHLNPSSIRALLGVWDRLSASGVLFDLAVEAWPVRQEEHEVTQWLRAWAAGSDRGCGLR